MITVSKGLLKAKMLEYFRKIQETGEELIVTDHGTPVLKVSSIKPKISVDALFGDVRPKFRGTEESILSPTTDEWEGV